MTTSKDDRDIRVHVRERYGQIAGSQSGCCGPEGSDCCSQTSLYQLSDVDDLPAEVLDLSLGCGDPISLAQLQEGQVVLDLGAGGGIDCFSGCQAGRAGRPRDRRRYDAGDGRAGAGQPGAHGRFQRRVSPGRDRTPAGRR